MFATPPHRLPYRHTAKAWLKTLLLIALGWVAAACAPFPQADPSTPEPEGLSAQAIFNRMLAEHGGDTRQYPGDINLSTDGRWYPLILRIQPEITDAQFRITSQERYRPSDGVYAVRHTGPGGVKQVVRSPQGLSVYYNGTLERSEVKRRATALTNDTFRMFHFGPSYFLDRTAAMVRLPDAREDGRRFHRLLLTLRPGFGESLQDQAVLWVDAQRFQWYRVHQTLNGFETTQGAHVDTTFLEHRRVGPFLFPVHFFERVRGPLQIDAHEWLVTGIALDRGWTSADVLGPEFLGAAAAELTPLAPAVQLKPQ